MCGDDNDGQVGPGGVGFATTTPNLRGDRGTLDEIQLCRVSLSDQPTPAEGLVVVDDAILRAAAHATQSGVMRHLGVSQLSEQAADDFRVIMAGLTQATRLDSCLAFPNMETMTHRIDVELDPGSGKVLLMVRFSGAGGQRIMARGELALIGGSASTMDWNCEDSEADLNSLDAIGIEWILAQVRFKLFPK